MAELIKQNGNVNKTCEYLASRAAAGSRCRPRRQPDQGPVLAHRPAEEACRHRRAGDVSGRRAAEGRRLDARRHAQGRRSLPQGGLPVRHRARHAEDNVDTAGAIFQSFGAALVDEKGNITVKSDEVRQALEYYKKLAQWLPPDAPAWDNASNNKYLISGKGSLIMNPPSAWAVAKRDAPQVAEQCWTHGMPSGPDGRYAPFLPYFWGIWNFGKNKTAAKSLLLHLSQPVGGREDGGGERRLRPAGVREAHDVQGLGRGRAAEGHALSLSEPAQSPDPVGRRAPAPPKIAHQIYTQAIMTKMVVRFMKGEAMERTLAWAESELEGFMRDLSCACCRRAGLVAGGSSCIATR